MLFSKKVKKSPKKGYEELSPRDLAHIGATIHRLFPNRYINLKSAEGTKFAAIEIVEKYAALLELAGLRVTTYGKCAKCQRVYRLHDTVSCISCHVSLEPFEG